MFTDLFPKTGPFGAGTYESRLWGGAARRLPFGRLLASFELFLASFCVRCWAVFPGSAAEHLLTERWAPFEQVRLPSRLGGKLKAPRGAFWTRVYYDTPDAVDEATANCTDRRIKLVGGAPASGPVI